MFSPWIEAPALRMRLRNNRAPVCIPVGELERDGHRDVIAIRLFVLAHYQKRRKADERLSCSRWVSTLVTRSVMVLR